MGVERDAFARGAMRSVGLTTPSLSATDAIVLFGGESQLRDRSA
jgi:hypothetical protein